MTESTGAQVVPDAPESTGAGEADVTVRDGDLAVSPPPADAAAPGETPFGGGAGTVGADQALAAPEVHSAADSDTDPDSNGDSALASDVNAGAEPAGDEFEGHDDLVAEGDAAGDYLERLLDILDYDGDIDLDVEGERAVVSVIGQGDLEKLVGARGEVLDALQELTRLAAGVETGQRSRLMLDIAGFRAKRRAELEELARDTAERVVASGSAVKLGAMNPFERKVVHDAVATVAGVTSSSEGEEPHRRVVVTPVG